MVLPTMFLPKHETECHVWTRIDNNRQRTGNAGYPAELFPMEVQVALDHVPTTRTSPGMPTSVHFFLLAFSAALVVLPATSLGVVALMTPTATVCLMSLTANLPRGGNSAKGSTHMGLLGISLTMAASPDLMNLGASSVDFPVRLSTFSKISANLQAMWAVWQSSTGE